VVGIEPVRNRGHRGMTREWADVYVPAPTERIALESRALFFVPAALSRCAAAGLTTGYLGSLANAGLVQGPRAGRVAIRKVMHQHPVSYERAVGFMNVANHALAERGIERFKLADIVACVFRLKDPTEIASELALTAQDISALTGLPLTIVVAALGRYRIQYNDASAIWRLFQTSKEQSRGWGPKADAALTGIAQDFIKTDIRQPLAVKSLEDDEFVYTWQNLEVAERAGHYWAIDIEEAEGTPLFA
jgi:hypothetical protein